VEREDVSTQARTELLDCHGLGREKKGKKKREVPAFFWKEKKGTEDSLSTEKTKIKPDAHWAQKRSQTSLVGEKKQQKARISLRTNRRWLPSKGGPSRKRAPKT